MTATKAISRLLAWSPIVFGSMALRPRRCIFATRVGLDVLEAFDVAAVARPVVACVANAPYVSWRETDRSAAAPPGAWAVWAGLPLAPDDPLETGKGWPGHLVVYLPGLAQLLDLDFQQFRRPAKLLDTPPAVVADWPADVNVAHYVGHDARRRLFVARYERNETNRGYVAAVDWDRNRPIIRDTVAALVRLIRKGSPS